MELEVSFSCLQQPATGTYLELYESNPNPENLFP
jgi:hypothetical protein